MNPNGKYRRYRAYLTALGTTQLHLRNPWVPAFFSFSFPGFGYLLQSRYLKAFTFIGWEVFINHQAQINQGILYSLLGQFDRARSVLNEKWLMLYVGIYLYAIWDGYRTTVDLNKQYVLADCENAPLPAISFSAWDINYLDRRNPWVAIVWSMIGPGLGHLYNHKVITGLFIFASTIGLMYYSHLPLAIYRLMLGEFKQSTGALDMQWTLYLPSVYAFIFYDAYISAVEQNRLFKKAQSIFLKERYQNTRFKMPI